MTSEEKLWKWAGFKRCGDENLYESQYWYQPNWYQPKSKQAQLLPKLTWKNIEKWIVPLLHEKGIAIEITIARQSLFPNDFLVVLKIPTDRILEGRKSNLAEAFLNALEKLIDSEAKIAKV